MNVASVEYVLSKRLGKMLDAAGLDKENGDIFGDPVAWGMRQLGYAPAELDFVTDAEVGAVSSAHVDALLDLAELRTLESILTNYTSVDAKVGQVWEYAGQLLEQLRTLVPEKRKAVQAAHGRLLVAPLVEDASRGVFLRAL